MSYPSYQYTVFINHANSPLGFEITRKLARSGYMVFASDSSLYDIGHLNLLNPEVSDNIIPIIHNHARDSLTLIEKAILFRGVYKLDYVINLDTKSNKELNIISELRDLIDSNTSILVGANDDSSKKLDLSLFHNKFSSHVKLVKTPNEITFVNISSVVHKFYDVISKAPYKIKIIKSFRDFLQYIAYNFVPILPLTVLNKLNHRSNYFVSKSNYH